MFQGKFNLEDQGQGQHQGNTFLKRFDIPASQSDPDPVDWSSIFSRCLPCFFIVRLVKKKTKYMTTNGI